MAVAFFAAGTTRKAEAPAEPHRFRRPITDSDTLVLLN